MRTANRLLLVLSLCCSMPALPDAGAGLPRSTPESQGIAATGILDFVEQADATIDTMNSFMLVRHGHVVAEGWWAPYDAASPHILYSLTKSFTSTAVGMAVAEGKLNRADKVVDFFPGEVPEDASDNLKAMRVHDLLRMATGHETEPPFRDADVPWTTAFLTHPVPHRPGTHFLYNTPASHMLSAIVQQATGRTTEAYLRPRLFEPLGIDAPVWLKSPEGASSGGYGLSITTEDIAKFGQLYLQKGLWQDEQLLPAAWVEAATSLQVANGSDPASDWNQGYGYQFWRSRYASYRADGAFGQFCIVLPEQDAVIAITSGVADMQAVLDLVFARLLPTMRAGPLAPDPQGLKALEERVAALSVKRPAAAAASRLAGEVAGDRYEFPDNELGIDSLVVELGAPAPAVVVAADGSEHRLPVATDGWEKSRAGFAFGLEDTPGLPAGPYAVAASGGWEADDRFVVKLVLYETPFYVTVALRFDGAALHLQAQRNVAFGPNEKVTLVGRRQRR